MGADGVQRSQAQAWAELQEACRPQSAEDDRSSPSLWLLIQAAGREPSLSAMYPWISMRQLGVSASDSWEEWGREPLPAMFARPDAYLVVGRPVGGQRVALETADPAEAAAFAARLVRDRRAAAAAAELTRRVPVGAPPSTAYRPGAGATRRVRRLRPSQVSNSKWAARTKGPHVWPAEVEAVLRGAGWYPGRSVDTTVWRERLEADGFHIHSAAEEFLREFGGLTVGTGGSGITSTREAFELDLLLALGEDDRFGEWGEEIGRRVAPLGEVDHGRFFLGLDEHAELYLVAGRPARFGRMPEALENLVLGVMPVHMPDSAQP